MPSLPVGVVMIDASTLTKRRRWIDFRDGCRRAGSSDGRVGQNARTWHDGSRHDSQGLSMPIDPFSTPASIRRRLLLLGGLISPWAGASAAGGAEGRLRQGGVVIVFRHAQAPGVYDPPSFKLGDCSTQRNLDAEGRAQARRIGAWFKQRGLQPTQMRSSPWCRCIDTATLAFADIGGVQPWAALGSPRIGSDAENAAALQALHRGIADAPHSGFEVWVTHSFVLSALVGSGAGSGEGLVMSADAAGLPQVLARLPPL
ncbi:MAG: histidine phosphatase family protein [Rubrivivax sp.]